MASRKDDAVAVEKYDDIGASEAEIEAATIPVETLKSLAEIIARHPDEMLRVIRRYMEDDTD